jgi:hypothetical protein
VDDRPKARAAGTQTGNSQFVGPTLTAYAGDEWPGTRRGPWSPARRSTIRRGGGLADAPGRQDGSGEGPRPSLSDLSARRTTLQAAPPEVNE